MRTDSIRYLREAGFSFKSSESPDLWSHLASCFDDSSRVGIRFNHIPFESMEALIAGCEEILLQAMVQQHRHTGRLGPITQVVDLPYVIGTGGAVPLKDIDERDEVLRLVDRPGTPREQVVHLLLAPMDALPCTHQVTISGGLYADGHTAGYFGLYPGRYEGAPISVESYDFLATIKDVERLVHEMEGKAEDIAIITREECNAMLVKAKKILG